MDVDVAVVGLGVLGAATLRELARRGLRVVGLEQFRLGHARGSSHGRSRALRFLYHAPEYVALLRPAVDGWRELEAESGRSIYLACGTLFFARPGNQLFDQNLAVMAGGGLPYELLDEATAGRRFPAFAMTDGAVGVFNPDGGLVDADAAVGAFLAGARAAGAQIRDLTRVLRIASRLGRGRAQDRRRRDRPRRPRGRRVGRLDRPSRARSRSADPGDGSDVVHDAGGRSGRGRPRSHPRLVRLRHDVLRLPGPRPRPQGGRRHARPRGGPRRDRTPR